MRKFIVLFLITLQTAAFAHQSKDVHIDKVKVETARFQNIIHFDLQYGSIENLHGVEIELLVDGMVMDFVELQIVSGKTKQEAQIIIPSYVNIKAKSVVQLKISRINDIEGTWDVVQVPFNPKQYDNVGAYELFADAPWRMDIYDDNNNKNPIPIHFTLHDGDGFSYPWIQYIDISFKKSTDASFGAPINFNSLSAAQFDALFSSKSTTDASLDRKAFDDSQAVKDANHTIAFRENYYNPWFGSSYYYTSLQNFLWYSTINIPASIISGYLDTDHLDVKVEFTIRNTFLSNPITYLRIFRQAESVPSLADWYRGDTHLHSIYTQNTAEQGLDLSATKEVAKHIGLDWIITTDHTSDFDNYGNGNINTNWAKLRTEVINLNTTDPSMIYIRGQEVSLKNSIGEVVHFLGYPSVANPTNSNFLGDGDGDAIPTNVTADAALNNLFINDGFAYAAHPFATGDELNPIINGGIWNLGDDDFPTNGNNFPQTGGNIIANNPNVPSDILVSNGNSTTKFVKDAMKGGQIWNERVSLSSTDDPQDPYNVQGGNAPFTPVAFDLDHYWNRFSQGLEIVNFINQKGLLLKNTYPSIENWKFYFSAGSDAHGSFNYSNTNSIQSFVGGLGGSTQNSAVGKVSTIAFAPNGMGLHGTNILNALYEGNISLSDGPILVQGFSFDGKNASNELLMGEDAEISLTDTNQLYLNLEYVSSTEFGNIASVDLILGTSSGEMTVNLPVSGTDTSLSISQIISLFGISNVPIDEYFYLRQALTTVVSYGPGTPQIISSENYHSLTNPVWMNLKTPNVLPVEWLSFELFKEEEVVRLIWKTATEINNDGFEVQRSQNAEDWEKIAWIDGKGNSTLISKYIDIDTKPYTGLSYYRIKQVDFDGTYEYSEIKAVDFKGTRDIVVYPNPFNDLVHVQNLAPNTSIRLLALNGKIIKAYESAGNDALNVSDLPSGVYFLIIGEGENRLTRKIIKN